jgi:hypothetical protein
MTIHPAQTLLLSLSLLAAGSLASAQATLKLDQASYVSGATMLVTVVLSPGQAVAKPRFHFIADGEPLPKRNSKGWIDFSALAETREVSLRAPQKAEPELAARWWLILNDGDRLIARTPFDELGFILALELKRAELEAAGVGESPTGPMGAPAATTSRGLVSTNGFISVSSSRDLLLGETVVVTVKLPAGSPDDADPVTLKWGATADLSWEQKEAAPEPSHSSAVPVPGLDSGPQQLSVVTPLSKPGRYELRLFRGNRLLDVLALTIL